MPLLDVQPYPRPRLAKRLGIATILLSVGLGFGYGIPTGIRTTSVLHTQAANQTVATDNHFWEMVAGNAPADGSNLGRIAAQVRTVAGQSQGKVIKGLKEFYVAPGSLPDVGSQLGYHIFDGPNEKNDIVTDRGHFTDEFVLNALQALGTVEGSSVTDLLQTNQPVPSYDYWRWDWGVEALGGLLAAGGLIQLILRRNRRRWPAKAEQRAIAALSPQRREVYEIICRAQKQPESEERKQLLTDAEAAFKSLALALDPDAELRRLQEQLNDLTEGHRLQAEAYRELQTGQ